MSKTKLTLLAAVAIGATSFALACDYSVGSLSEVLTLAGTGKAGSDDGVGKKAKLNRPHGMVQAGSGLVYFADRGTNRIRTYQPKTGEVKTIAGGGVKGFADGSGAEVRFNQPVAVAVTRKGIVFVADRDNHRIRRVASDGTVSTLAGDGTAGFKDGDANQARFNEPYGVALDSDEKNLLVADYLNHAVRKIVLKTGKVLTVVGNGEKGLVDGQGKSARLSQPYNIVHDGKGNYYIPDQKNHAIRVFLKSGELKTVAGTGDAGYRDGKSTEAQFNNPTGVAVSSDGSVYVSDRNNHRIRKISHHGKVTTVSGTGSSGDTEGGLSAAEFNEPLDVIIDSTTKTLIVSEDKGHRLRSIR